MNNKKHKGVSTPKLTHVGALKSHYVTCLNSYFYFTIIAVLNKQVQTNWFQLHFHQQGTKERANISLKQLCNQT